MFKKIALVSSLTLCGACANFSPLTDSSQVPVVVDGGAQWLTYDSTRRGTLIIRGKDSNGNEQVMACAEPAPDTGYSFDNKLKLDGTRGETTVGAEAAFAATIVSLAGRDNLVLMTRESMFRLCEARANGFITNAQYNDRFSQLLDKIVEIAQAVKTQSETAQQALTAALAK